MEPPSSTYQPPVRYCQTHRRLLPAQPPWASHGDRSTQDQHSGPVVHCSVSRVRPRTHRIRGAIRVRQITCRGLQPTVGIRFPATNIGRGRAEAGQALRSSIRHDEPRRRFIRICASSPALADGTEVGWSAVSGNDERRSSATEQPTSNRAIARRQRDRRQGHQNLSPL